MVCRTAYGNLLVGPTAEEQEDRDHADLVTGTLAGPACPRARRSCPRSRDHEVTAVYAGLRPATEFKDYRIRRRGRPALHHRGRHPLDRAEFGARHRARMCSGFARRWGRGFARPPRRSGRACPTSPTAAPRDWQSPGNGGIVCHCELVTRREIEAALSGPLAARSLAGLKRRTRVTMGRCQGFYCSAALARMTDGRSPRPMALSDDGRQPARQPLTS